MGVGSEQTQMRSLPLAASRKLGRRLLGISTWNSICCASRKVLLHEVWKEVGLPMTQPAQRGRKRSIWCALFGHELDSITNTTQEVGGALLQTSCRLCHRCDYRIGEVFGAEKLLMNGATGVYVTFDGNGYPTFEVTQ
jgi:hypothetical protein